MDHNQKQRPNQPSEPCRTIFVRNVQFDAQESDVRDKFEPFGDIKVIFNLISRRGLVFVTYYDIRSAEKAMTGLLHNIEFRGRKADIHYSLPKEEDQEKNQGTLDIILQSSEKIIVENEIFEFMSRFGEVKVIRPVNDDPKKKMVSFWDSRGCMRALEEIPLNNQYNGGTLSVKLGWDQGQDPSLPQNQRENQGGNYNQGGNNNQNSYRRNDNSRSNNQNSFDNQNSFQQSRQNQYNDRNNSNNSNNRDNDRNDRNDRNDSNSGYGGYNNRPQLYGNNNPNSSPNYNNYTQSYNAQDQNSNNLLNNLQNNNQYSNQTQAAQPAPNSNQLLTSLMQMQSQGTPAQPAQIQQLMSLLTQMTPPQGNQQYAQQPYSQPKQPIAPADPRLGQRYGQNEAARSLPSFQSTVPPSSIQPLIRPTDPANQTQLQALAALLNQKKP